MRKFLEMTEQSARDKAIKTNAIYNNMKGQAMVMPASRMDAFFLRLMEDSERRQVSRLSNFLHDLFWAFARDAFLFMQISDMLANPYQK